MSNTVNSNSSNNTDCNSFDPEYCLYRLPCGTCMMLKSACVHILNRFKSNVNDQYKLPTTIFNEIKAPSWETDTPDACKNCPNHPSNGGSGICNCTLGDWKVTC